MFSLLKTWLLVLIMVAMTSGAASGKSASGGINLAADVHQGLESYKSLNALGIGEVSTMGVLDSPLATKGGLPDNAIACRGGSCTAERFSKGSGVKPDGAGKLNGISVNSAGGKSLKELTQGIPHNKVGVTTVGDVRKAGGNVVSSPTRNNPNHATMSGVTAKQAEKLMNPTVKNPSK